jgi:hypothetical protein
MYIRLLYICYLRFVSLVLVAALRVLAGVGFCCAGRSLYNITYTIAKYRYAVYL